MDRTERFYRIDQLVKECTVVSFARMMEELGVSRATLKRDLQYMKDRLHAPIEYDRANNGYRFSTKPALGPRYELPGLWFNASEVYALLTMQHLLENLEPGLLAPHVRPLMATLERIVDPLQGRHPLPGPLPRERGARHPHPGPFPGERGTFPLDEIQRRIRIIRMAARSVKLEFFELAATATLRRQRLAITYWARHDNRTSERTVSPQRLTFYRGNWYLDAWCHKAEGIRTFALDGIRAAKLTGEKARNVPEGELEETLASSYGIFSGRPKGWAKLCFSPDAARWVASEKWHSRQRGRFEADGSFVLEVPFGDDRELVMDILKYGPDCRVVEPAALRERVAARASETAGLYA